MEQRHLVVGSLNYNRKPLEGCVAKTFIATGASLVAQLVKNLPAMRETWVQFLGGEDSPGEGNSYLLQYSGLENSMDRVVHGVAKSQTHLSDTFTFHFHRCKEQSFGLSGRRRRLE